MVKKHPADPIHLAQLCRPGQPLGSWWSLSDQSIALTLSGCFARRLARTCWKTGHSRAKNSQLYHRIIKSLAVLQALIAGDWVCIATHCMVQIWYVSSNLLAQPSKTRGRIAKIQSVISWERFWWVFPRTFLFPVLSRQHSGDLSMRIIGNVLGLQGQPKNSFPQTSIYPTDHGWNATFWSVWLVRLIGDSPKVKKNRLLRQRLGGPVGDFKDTGDFLSSKHLSVIEALLSRMCMIWQLNLPHATHIVHHDWLPGWISCKVQGVSMCILIQHVRNYSLTRKVEKWFLNLIDIVGTFPRVEPSKKALFVWLMQ